MRELMVAENPSSITSESIKNIRTNLLFTEIDKSIKSILVTSSSPGDGKSYITSNLALSFVQLNKKVLILDCDMRKGRQHEIFKISNVIGLSNLLLEHIVSKDEANRVYDEYIVNTKFNNLDIIPCGFYPPNPSDMLSSQKFGKILKDLEKKYDAILIDGVPLGYLSDSLEIAKHIDKIVLVTSINGTPKEDLAEAIKKLRPFEEKLAGVVINKVEIKKEDTYYYKKEAN